MRIGMTCVQPPYSLLRIAPLHDRQFISGSLYRRIGRFRRSSRLSLALGVLASMMPSEVIVDSAVVPSLPAVFGASHSPGSACESAKAQPAASLTGDEARSGR